MPQIEIRPATVADLPHISKLEHVYQTEYVWQMDQTLEDGSLEIHFRKTRLPRMVTMEYPFPFEKIKQNPDKGVSIFTACLENVPVSYACVNENKAPESAWVTSLVVRESLRRQGIASGLMLALHQWATRKGLRRIVLEVQSKNHPGIQFALKLGYDPSGYDDRYYNNHDIALFFAYNLR